MSTVTKPITTPSMIGAYGTWAATLAGDDPPDFSFRRDEWDDLDAWRGAARARFLERVSSPDTGGPVDVTVHRRYEYDGLAVEELSWQLAYGSRTEAILLKPAGATEPLPGLLALHDHAGNKYFGKRKISRTGNDQHSMMADHRQRYYGGQAWANEVAKRGYVVLIHDAFAFASRRVRLADMPDFLRAGLKDDDPENPANIEAYNRWAGNHEHLMAKALFSAGTTWPGVFLAEDIAALDLLCSRPDVDAARVGCGGLSGGGLRTVHLAGADERIRAAVCVGMMTTWRDYLLHKCHTHTWMCYTPLLPKELDYPEILGLRAPQPTLVLNNSQDPLFTPSEMARADHILAAVYAKAGVSERYRCSFYPGGHKFDPEMQAEAFTWLDSWLQ